MMICDEGNRLEVWSRSVGALVQAAVWQDQRDDSLEQVAKGMGLVLPQDGRAATSHGSCVAYRIAPHCLLLRDTSERGLFSEVRAALAKDQGAVTDLSHARMLFEIVGSEAAALLSHLVPVDLGDRLFPINNFVQSSLRDASVLLHHEDTGRFAMLVPTSFSASVADKVQHAASLMRK